MTINCRLTQALVVVATSVPTVPTAVLPTVNMPSLAPASGLDSTQPSPVDSSLSASYKLSYTLDAFRIATDTDYIGVTQVTDSFVNEQLSRHFLNVSGVQFSYSNTTRDEEEFNGPNAPVVVTYTTEVTTGPSSETEPTTDELGAILEEAFSPSGDLDTYLADLAALPANNLFQSTTSVEYEAVPAVDGGSAESTEKGIASMSTATLGGIAAAGAGILIVLAGGFVALRRGGKDTDGHAAAKYIDGDTGGMTVAGDTYAGSTYAGTSMDAESVQHSGWGNHSHFSTPSYRTHSPTESLNDGNDSDSTGDESPPVSPGQLQTVDL